MLPILRQALSLLDDRERRRFFRLLVLSGVAAIVQAVAIFSVMPFIVVLANPDILQTNNLLIRAYQLSGAESYTGFLTLLGGVGILFLTVGNLFLAFEHWVSQRFLVLLGHRIEKLVLTRVLARPYEFHARQHTARLGDVVLRQVERVVDGVMGSLIVAFSNVALTVFIVLMLLLVSLQSTVVAFAVLFAGYLGVFLLLRRRIAGHGETLTRLSGSVATHVREMLDGIKEVKARKAEGFFARRFETSSLALSKLAIRYGMLSFLPNFIMETLIFAGLVGVALYFVVTTQGTAVSLSYIALYGIATYRLVPALKGVFEGISEIQHNAGAVRIVSDHCETTKDRVAQVSVAAPEKAIMLRHVNFSHAGNREAQIHDVSLSIQAGTSICLFGPSGSGKTTLLNILVGLLDPQSGEVLCDDTPLTPSTRDAWRARLGYCPQDVFLFDDSIACNIAFGVPAGEILPHRVADAARSARLDTFVAGLPRQFDTVIGEDGKTLSGGQRQRIGIARALYHDPEILILDESFTGLDSAIKEGILDELFALPGKTLVFASHEPAIAASCDTVALMERGRLIAHASFDELAAGSRQYARLLAMHDE